VVAKADVTLVAFDGAQNKAVQIDGELKTLLESMLDQ